MSRDVQDLANRMRRIGENIRSVQDILDVIGEEVVAEIKRDYGMNGLQKQSYRLFGSIYAQTSPSALIFGMLSYGAYNNYGVMPKPTFKYGGDMPFATPNGHRFRYKNRPGGGLPSRQFYDEKQIAEKIQQRLVEELTRPLTD